MGDWPEGVDRRVLESVDSTNAEAARIAPGLAGPCWIMALRQTAARGRRGRAWANPQGNFAATLVLRPTEPPAQAALRSFVAALALRDALVTLTGQEAAFRLKWPNDVLVNGGKLAGILLESAGQGGGMAHLAIGIGVNLARAPAAALLGPEAVPPASLAAETGVSVTPLQFLETLAPAYDRRERQFVTYGFAPIRTAWLAHAARLGAPVTARTGRETLTGTFETVDETGNLLLKTGDGRRAIPAADVFF